ncbi:MAG: DNA polymerase, partial [Pseudomonadota bacterium]
LEPQSLKDLAWRHLGAKQDEYLDLIAEADGGQVRACVEGWTHHENAKVRTAATRVLAKIDDPEEERKPRKIWTGSKFSKAVDPIPQVTLDAVDPAVALRYACRDADLTERLRPILYRRIKARGLETVYRRDMAVIPIVQRMQCVGMRIDPAHFRGLLQQFDHDYLDVHAAIARLVGVEVNPNSGDQVARLLFDELELPRTRLTRSRSRSSTEDKFLEALRGAHPVVALIIDARELTKLRSAFVSAILDAAHGGDLIFPHLRITRVVSGRVSAFDPNVLAIPKHSARGKLIRMGFLAGDGRVLLSHDLSQIELRIAAHDSQERGMLKVFREGGDIHASLGQRIFGVKPEDQDESKHRLPCKKVNFGIWMGISAGGVGDQIRAAGVTMSNDDCQRLMDETMRVWPGIPRYQSEKIAQARRLGYVTDFCGRRRYLAGVHSPDARIRAEAERQAHATPIQSGAQEVFKEWMAAVWRRVLQPRQRSRTYLEPWLQVHDDLIVEADRGVAARASVEILACIPQLLRVPTTAKAKSAERWGEL